VLNSSAKPLPKEKDNPEDKRRIIAQASDPRQFAHPGRRGGAAPPLRHGDRASWVLRRDFQCVAAKNIAY